MIARSAQGAFSGGSGRRLFIYLRSLGRRCWKGEDRELARRVVIVDMIAHMLDVWMVDDSADILAHIACWHRTVEEYRGYVLYADSGQRIFLVDMRSWKYVRASPTQLLMVEGIEGTKALVDAFCLHLHT